jgi:hypothetical protein
VPARDSMKPRSSPGDMTLPVTVGSHHSEVGAHAVFVRTIHEVQGPILQRLGMHAAYSDDGRILPVAASCSVVQRDKQCSVRCFCGRCRHVRTLRNEGPGAFRCGTDCRYCAGVDRRARQYLHEELAENEKKFKGKLGLDDLVELADAGNVEYRREEEVEAAIAVGSSESSKKLSSSSKRRLRMKKLAASTQMQGLWKGCSWRQRGMTAQHICCGVEAWCVTAWV